MSAFVRRLRALTLTVDAYEQTFLLASLVNRPRMRLSKAQIGAILWLLRQLGHSDAPSLKTFQASQNRVRDVTALATVSTRTPTGKVFYRNRISALIRMVRCLGLSILASTVLQGS